MIHSLFLSSLDDLWGISAENQMPKPITTSLLTTIPQVTNRGLRDRLEFDVWLLPRPLQRGSQE